MSLERLPHRLNLLARGIDIPTILCPSYNGNVESADHIFFECYLVKEVWLLVRKCCDIPFPPFVSFILVDVEISKQHHFLCSTDVEKWSVGFLADQKTSLITHLRDRHCNGDVQAITRQSLSVNLVFLGGRGFCGDGVVRFVLYEIIKPHVPSSSEQINNVDDLVLVQHKGFTLVILDSFFKRVAYCEFHPSQVSFGILS
ncbi:RNA-directed DNA polymerase, eukaryota, partial [Tanacetum coccineum]